MNRRGEWVWVGFAVVVVALQFWAGLSLSPTGGALGSARPGASGSIAPPGPVSGRGSAATLVGGLDSAPSYALGFNESGLPNGTNWWVNLTGIASANSTGSEILFSEPNGTYNYTVASADRRYAASNGSAIIDDAPTTVFVTFALVTFNVTFAESGLPTGTPWRTTLAGVGSNETTASSMTFLAPNGTYSYAIATTNSSYAAPPGNVTVNGSAILIGVGFQLVTYGVQFVAAGLLTGASWGVYLGDQVNYTTNASLVFLEPNGSYNYTVLPPDGFIASPPSGSLNVSGKNVTVDLQYLPIYPVTFEESGLLPGQVWSVISGLGTNSTNAPSMVFWGPNSTYPYTVGPPEGSSATPAFGTVEVAGGPVNVTISFALLPGFYALNFTETGLPLGRAWSVSLDGVAESSSGTSVGFGASDGNYSFGVGAPWGFRAAPARGTVTVNDSNLSVPIVFTRIPYTLLFNATFNPRAFPVEWGVTVVTPNGTLTAYNTTVPGRIAGTIWLLVPAGPVSFQFLAPAGYGAVRVLGGPRNTTFGEVYVAPGRLVGLTVSFGALENVSFWEPRTLPRFELPSGTLWSVTLTPTSPSFNSTGATKNSTGQYVNFSLPTGAHDRFQVSKPSTYRAFGGRGSLSVGVRGWQHQVRFVPYTGRVTIVEKGLPRLTNWTVYLNGTENYSQSSTRAIMKFVLFNGTYTLEIPGVLGLTATSVGAVVVVAPHGQTVRVVFAPDSSSTSGGGSTPTEPGASAEMRGIPRD